MSNNYSKNIIYLSDAQYQELITNQSITVNGTTVIYNDNDIYITPQTQPITQVQLAGSNIGVNGIANIPAANGSTYGVVKVGNATAGLRFHGTTNELQINPTPQRSIIDGISSFDAVTTGSQHYSTFFGLSKAAGVDLRSANIDMSSLAYPDSSKAAIQNMLGITDLLSTEESSTATVAHAINSTFMMDGKLHRATAAIAIGDAVEVGTNCEVVKADEVFVKNTDYATTSTPGIVKIDSARGLTMGTGQFASVIMTCAATSSQIKSAGTSNYETYRVITPRIQHESVFYGLAKVAGADEKNSELPLGTYSDNAQVAIRNMLGAVSSDVIAVQDEQPTTTDTKVWLPETEQQGIEVPTYAEHQALASTVAGLPSDIQIKGTSIVNNNVANIPVAGSNILGVVKSNSVENVDGIMVSVNDVICISPADTVHIKSGTYSRKPICTNKQHEAVFYGLAKAAGDTTQSISTNAVGTYTDSAKIAIKNMLGVTQTLTVTVLTQDNVTVTGQTVTVRAANATGHVFATAAYEGQPVSFAVPSGFAYYVSVSDTLAHHFNPTTASGVITDADASVTLTYSDFSSIQTAADIKAALNAGLDLTDLVGEQISCTWNNSTLVWDVVDYSNDTITLLTHDTLPTQLVFEPVQALMWCENGLAAGSYSFIDGSSTYYFTLTTAIPSGGQLRATTSTFQTYASMEATATLETGTVSTTEISDTTSLGTTASGNLNHMSRVNYGSNNYKESALFQWLNSTEAANIPMPRITKFSRPCTYSVPGFLGALDSGFVAAIDDTTWLCSTNNTYECPTSLGGTVAKSNAYTVTAKVGLASEMEIFGSYGGTADGSAVFDLFNGATADDRKKYQPGTSTARYWWLRSPNWSSASHERSVDSSGAAYGHSVAYGSGGVVPAVKISKMVVSE